MIEGGYWWLMLGGMLFAPRLALGIWLCTVGNFGLGLFCLIVETIWQLGKAAVEISKLP